MTGRSTGGQLTEGKNKRHRYPVVTLVLYFGSQRWNKYTTLIERLKVPEGLEKYVNDYKLNVVEVAYLSDETIEKFRSDFKDVAKFFVAQRTGRKVEFSSRELKHVDEILKLLQAVSKEEDITNLFRDEEIDKGGKVSMGNLFRRYKNEGIREGREEGFVSVAVGMIKKSMPVQLIQELTNLSLKQLQQLSEECGVALVSGVRD